MKLYGSKNFRQAAYREIIKLFGQKEGLELYNIIRPLLPASGSAQKKTVSKTGSKSSAPAPAKENTAQSNLSPIVVDSND